jgi:hypothetical protein
MRGFPLLLMAAILFLMVLTSLVLALLVGLLDRVKVSFPIDIINGY